MIRILTGDCRDILRTLPSESVHCCVTSPPYFGLRDYGATAQIGLEQTPQEYVEQLVSVFREVRRVLRKDGTVWLNLGDSYASAWACKRRNVVGNGSPAVDVLRGRMSPGLKEKDLIGIPWRVAFALQADGWWLRQDIIWSKPNPMPESVTDRCTKAHEYIFLLSKSARYYYDAGAISEEITDSSVERLSQPNLAMQAGSYRVPGKTNGPMKAVGSLHMNGTPRNDGDRWRLVDGGVAERGKRNKRSVWTVATQPYSEAHFATFPPALIEPCIKAGTSEKGCCAKCGNAWVRNLSKRSLQSDDSELDRYGNGTAGVHRKLGQAYQKQMDANPIRTIGWLPSCTCMSKSTPCTVLDPFAGAGTTGLVADRLGRNALLIELNPEYAAMTGRRLADDAGMFAQVAAE